jgi:hypothetical protein
MLSLDSPRWSELRHAYGPASDIPALIVRLENPPAPQDRDEAWFALWSALAHQGDVYPASFAAVPHVVRILADAPEPSDSSSFFQFPAWVEICRQNRAVRVPEDLAEAYFAALGRLPALAAVAASRDGDAEFLCCALAAIAAAKGEAAIAEVLLELTPAVAQDCLDWLRSR